MDELFWAAAQANEAQTGYQPTDADIDRMIGDIENDMEVEYDEDAA